MSSFFLFAAKRNIENRTHLNKLKFTSWAQCNYIPNVDEKCIIMFITEDSRLMGISHLHRFQYRLRNGRLAYILTESEVLYAVPKYHKFICENFIQFWFSPMFVFSVHSWKRTLIFCENKKLNLIVDFGQVSTVHC